MENIVQSNNRDLRLVAVKVGVLSTLRLALPDVPANATRVEVIVTNGDTHTAYGAHLDSATEHWLVDIAAAQFPVCGKQKYEIAYLLDGKQFWDGAGWVTIEDATTGGITPSPAPDPARYVVTRINGYGAPNPDGEVRIPRTFVGTEDPTTTDTFIEFDQYLNKETGALFVLCSVGGTLTWVKNTGAVSSVNGMVGAVEVQTLKINDEWRFSVAPGLSGEMAIRLEHLDFPAQGIWGIQTEMTIPTGLGTLAKSSDIPEISTTFTSADAGKAADAKAVGEALMGKVDAVAVKEEFLPITDVNETYDLSSYTIRKGGEYYSAYDASGNIMCSWRLDGVWMAGDSGIRFNGRTPPGDIPMLKFGATISDISDATKLTPVFSEWTLGDHAPGMLIRNISATYDEVKKGWETTEELSSDGGQTWNEYTVLADENPDPDKTATSITCISATFVRTIIGYRLGPAEDAPILIEVTEKTDAQGKTTYELPDPIKATLFAGADFSNACAYKIVTVGSDGMMTDRAINVTSAASATVPGDYTDLLIRASVNGSLSVTVPDGVTKYGDAFPSETGEYLVTITKLATGEAFVKTLKLEVANA